MRQYPYFVRLFQTSTPLRTVELSMKKESRDLVASAGHLWFLSHSDSVGYWPVSSSWMKPCNLENFFFNISIMKNLTDFPKLVETSVDPHLCYYSRKYGILIVFQ